MGKRVNLMSYLEIIMQIFNSINSKDNKEKNLLATELFNESWMLRLVLYWFNKHENRGKHFHDMPISMNSSSCWFSEGRLESKFQDEQYTRADGIYGNIKIGGKGNSDVRLDNECKQFIVTEAKTKWWYDEIQKYNKLENL
jgi:hypothetical protein